MQNLRDQLHNERDTSKSSAVDAEKLRTQVRETKSPAAEIELLQSKLHEQEEAQKARAEEFEKQLKEKEDVIEAASTLM